MDEIETPPFTVEELDLLRFLFCPLYDSEPESETGTNLSILSVSDEDDYHSLPPSPMASPPLQFDPFRCNSSEDFFDSCPMETDVSHDELESHCNPDLGEWTETERETRFSMEVVSEQGDDLNTGRDPPGSDGLPDLNEFGISSFEEESDLAETVTTGELLRMAFEAPHEIGVGRAPDPFWVDTLEFPIFQEMVTDVRQVQRPLSPDTQFTLDNLPREPFNRLPIPDLNQHLNTELEPDWEAVSTDSSIPDLEETVRNMEWEVLLAMNNIYEGDPEMAFFRQYMEQDSAVKGGPGASKSVVESLLSITVDDSMVDLQCAICKDLVLVGESVRRLPCSHDYHANCILPWLGIRNTCPLCRFELPTDDPNYESLRTRQENQV
ncbi:uncharacterized protein LOC144555808 [Carex rostrata]